MRTPAVPSSTVPDSAVPSSAVPSRTDALAGRVAEVLRQFVAAKAVALRAVDDDLAPVAELAVAFVMAGGKGLRPASCYWGWRGAGGDDSDEAVSAAAALELLHACALVHDDVMDRSHTRRGRPTVHRQLAALHRRSGWRADPDEFGRSAAVLLGDAFLAWADELLVGSGMPPGALVRAWPVYADMRTELVAGQYLDLATQAAGRVDAEAAARTARLKSAGYTVKRPLQLGGVLAGASPALLATYVAFGLLVGEAFQLRDDVLGTFGDPSQTGKPSGDDLRYGKRTALVAATLDRCDPVRAAHVERLLSRGAAHPTDRADRADRAACADRLDGPRHPDDATVDELRTIIVEVGALDAVERAVTALTDQALAVLRRGPLDQRVRDALADLVRLATAPQH